MAKSYHHGTANRKTAGRRQFEDIVTRVSMEPRRVEVTNLIERLKLFATTDEYISVLNKIGGKSIDEKIEILNRWLDIYSARCLQQDEAPIDATPLGGW